MPPWPSWNGCWSAPSGQDEIAGAFVKQDTNRLSLIMVHIGFYGAIAGMLGLEVFLAIPAIFAALLIWVSVIDIERLEVPDIASFLLVSLGILRVLLAPSEVDTVDVVLGGLLWPALFYGLAHLYLRRRGVHGLGFGDVKLIAGIGVWCGFLPVITVVLLASLAAIGAMIALSVLRRQSIHETAQSAIAFGPFLCLSAWAVFVSGISG